MLKYKVNLCCHLQHVDAAAVGSCTKCSHGNRIDHER
jgi:hypothetical protein